MWTHEPMSHQTTMNGLTKLLAAWNRAQQEGAPAILATVVRVNGSHYRRPGARMLAVLPDRPVGSVSGGCLEADLLDRATTVIGSGAAALVHYDTTSDTDLLFGSGLGCGGEVDILVESMSDRSAVRFLETLNTCITGRRCLSAATVLTVEGDIKVRVGGRLLVVEDSAEIIGIEDESILSDLRRAVAEVSVTARSKVYRVSTPCGWGDVYVEFLTPPVALAVFGSGEDARAVCEFASTLGWQVSVFSHRSTLLTRQRFPRAAALHACRPEDVGVDGRNGAFDAAVVMTHQYEYDRTLVTTLMGTGIPYIGLLGAAGRAERMLVDLERQGTILDERSLDRLYAPVGLDLQAEGPEEIALATVAEIQMVLHGGSPELMRRRLGRKHGVESTAAEYSGS